jgi:crotonobetainyl-CoA:carnitine CoA-transferase CaiB-like acyl-CoA transferase
LTISEPLSGVTVVDCSTGFAGTRTTGLLADYGAEVTWIEPPGGAPFRRLDPAAASVFNRGKRSVIVNLESGEREELYAWLGAADVLVADSEIETLDASGLGYDNLHARFPALIWCSITGFGRAKPTAICRREKRWCTP